MRVMRKRLLLLLIVLYFSFFPAVKIARAVSVQLVPVAEAAATTVDYPLPYPGILPNSPIYFLKVWRDQIMTWLITDPVQKSFYVLLLSDKRLAAGEMLIDSGDKTLGVATIVKADAYLRQAADLAVGAKQAKKDVNDLAAKLVVATAKHGEVLATLAGKVAGQEGVDLQKVRQDNADTQNRIMELLLGKGQ